MFNFWRQPSPDTHPLHPTHTGKVESDAVSVRNPQNPSQRQCSNCRTHLLTKPTFNCKICDYFLCAECNMSYDHPVHIQHKLNRACNTMPNLGSSWRCNVCSKSYPDSVCRYQCIPCGFNICEDCFAPKLHPLHKHHLTKTDVRHVYVNGHGQWFCDSCRHNNGPGNYYPWHCKNCQFDLCDNCVKPWSSSAHLGHALLKTDSRMVYARYDGGWGCDRCSATFSANVNNTPYHCEKCEFDLCKNCMNATGNTSNNVGFDVPAQFCPNVEREVVGVRSGAFTITQGGNPIASPQEEEVGRPGPTPDDAGECVICLLKPKNATIVHGETGHVCCCTDCALRLKTDNSPCPICRAPIDRVIRQYTV